MTTAPRFRRGGVRRRRTCLCKEATIDYKEVSLLRRMLTDRGRMDSAKKSGNCAKCQRRVSHAIQQARFLGLLPFSGDHIRVTSVISSSHPDEEDEDLRDSAEDYADDVDDSDDAESDDVLESASAAVAVSEDDVVEADETESMEISESNEDSEDVSENVEDEEK